MLGHGSHVGHYTIIKRIGAGGMGEVYLARDTKLEREVALKFLPLELCGDGGFCERFLREAQAAARVNHPNIVTIHEVGDYGGRPFFAMQYVAGPTLAEFIKSNPLTLNETIRLAIQICAGLEAAHARGIVHRDIKPANILVDHDGIVRLVDFGLAAVGGRDRLTRAGAVMGTFGYMSPEQVRGEEVDHRTDLFSFGVTLYELLTGNTPFRRSNEAATIDAILHASPEPLGSRLEGAPADLDAALMRLLEKDRDRRIQSAGEAAAALERILGGDGATILRPRPSTRRPPRKVWLWSALMIVVLAMSAVLLWPFNVLHLSVTTSQTPRLLILSFQSLQQQGPAPLNGEMIASLLTTDLSESPQLQIVSMQLVHDVLQDVEQKSGEQSAAAVTEEVAQQVGATLVLTGDILSAAHRTVLASRLIDVNSGTVIATQKIEDDQGTDVFTLVDHLAAEIFRDLPRSSSAAMGGDRKVAQMTTTSPEAYEEYLEGLHRAWEWDWWGGFAHFNKAIEYDSTFALAWLGITWNRLLRPEVAREAAAQALKYIDRVGTRDRLAIRARYELLHDHYDAYRVYMDSLVARFPDDKVALWQYGRAARQNYDYDRAVVVLQQALALDSDYADVYNELAYSFHYLRDFDKALAAADRQIVLNPGSPNPYDTRGEIFSFNGFPDSAAASFRQALALDPNFYSRMSLADIAVFTGHDRLADSIFLAFSRSEQAFDRCEARLWLAGHQLYRGHFARGIQDLYSGLEQDALDLDTLGHQFVYYAKYMLLASTYDLFGLNDSVAKYAHLVPYFSAGYGCWLLAKNGYIDQAHSLAAETEARIRVDSVYYVDLTTAQVLRGAGKSSEAIARFNQLPPGELLDQFGVRYALASAYRDAGEPRKAIENYELALKRYDRFRMYSLIDAVVIYYDLGRAYQQIGDRKHALKYYQDFLRIWNEADRDLPVLKDARARVSELSLR